MKKSLHEAMGFMDINHYDASDGLLSPGVVCFHEAWVRGSIQILVVPGEEDMRILRRALERINR